jgi:hypothetical protein
VKATIKILLTLGPVICLVGVIWSPEEAGKWILTAAYLFFVRKILYGRDTLPGPVVGERIVRDDFELKDFRTFRRPVK